MYTVRAAHTDLCTRAGVPCRLWPLKNSSVSSALLFLLLLFRDFMIYVRSALLHPAHALPAFHDLWLGSVLSWLPWFLSLPQILLSSDRTECVLRNSAKWAVNKRWAQSIWILSSDPTRMQFIRHWMLHHQSTFHSIVCTGTWTPCKETWVGPCEVAAQW